MKEKLNILRNLYHNISSISFFLSLCLQLCLYFFFSGMYSLLVNQICPPQQEVTQMINWVSRCFLAQFNKSFSQMRYYIIHQILSDWLRPCIKQISFLLPNEFQLRLFLFFSLLSASFILQLLLLSKDLLFFSLFFFLFLESYLSYNLVFFRI